MDNVTYLRACATNEPSELDADQLMDAAAEITRLRAEVERLNLSNQTVADELGAEIDRLQRKLDAAIRQAASGESGT